MLVIFEAELTHLLHTWNQELEYEPDLLDQAKTVLYANKYRLMAIGEHLKKKILSVTEE